MHEAVFATGVPWGPRNTLPAMLKDLGRLMPVCAGVRRWGAAALDLAYVAAGRFDGYWERDLNAWDVAAGVLLVKEAGGLVEGLREGTDPLDGALIAANDGLFKGFADVIRS
jgi:myo-inositol-1(or 4)-monophosphatase